MALKLFRNARWEIQDGGSEEQITLSRDMTSLAHFPQRKQFGTYYLPSKSHYHSQSNPLLCIQTLCMRFLILSARIDR